MAAGITRPKLLGFKFPDVIRAQFAAHPGRFGRQHRAIHHAQLLERGAFALQAAGLQVDGVRHRKQHVEIRRTAAVASQLQPCRVGDSADLHPFG